jgi:hypothetical protein
MNCNPQPILLIGIRQIGEAMGIGRHEVNRLLREPGFPVYRLSNRWVTTYSKLERWAEKLVPEPDPEFNPENTALAGSLVKR